jgi:YbgC/YbaW family acyl-CoA thioester hydrolase
VNLLFRLLKTLFLWMVFPRRLGILGESVVRYRVWPNDLDTNLHVNNGRYLTLMDLGRLDLLLRNGAVRHVLARKWYPVLASCHIRFRRPLNLFQRFEIRTRIVTWDEKWIYMEQRMLRNGGLVVHAYLKGVFVARAGGSVPITRLLELMGIAQAAPAMPPAMAAWIDAEARSARDARETG